MLIMDFLIDIGVTEILCSFRFVWGGKTGKGIPESWRLELLEGFLANNFTSSDAEDNTSGTLNRGGIADLLLLRTLIYLLFYWCVSLAASRAVTWAVTWAASVSCDGRTSSWKPSILVKLELIYRRKGMWINYNLNVPTNFPTSSISTYFKDSLPWNLSQSIKKTIAISTRIAISYAMKRGIPSSLWRKVIGNSDNSVICILPWRKS